MKCPPILLNNINNVQYSDFKEFTEDLSVIVANNEQFCDIILQTNAGDYAKLDEYICRLLLLLKRNSKDPLGPTLPRLVLAFVDVEKAATKIQKKVGDA